MTDDTISRQMAIDALNKLDVSDGVGISSIACNLQKEAIRSIENLPSAERKGHWYKNSTLINCSVCKHCSWSVNAYEDLVKTFKYCPNCGARMERE